MEDQCGQILYAISHRAERERSLEERQKRQESSVPVSQAATAVERKLRQPSQSPVLHGGGQGSRGQDTFHVNHDSAPKVIEWFHQLVDPHRDIGLVRHRQHDAIDLLDLLPRDKWDVILRHRFLRMGQGIMDDHLKAVVSELMNDVWNAAVAQVWNVLLEGEPKHRDPKVLDRSIQPAEELDGLLSDKLPHPIVDPAAGQNDLRVIPY